MCTETDASCFKALPRYILQYFYFVSKTYFYLLLVKYFEWRLLFASSLLFSCAFYFLLAKYFYKKLCYR